MSRAFNESEKEFIKENYGKIPYSQIAGKINRNLGEVQRCAAKMGIINRGNIKRNFSGQKAIKANENFFSSPETLNCYWAGFLAADGNVTEVSENQKRLTLKLAEKDLEHLEKFKNDLSYEGRVYSDNSKQTYKGATKIHVQKLIKISNKKIVEDLESIFNITPRKTFTLKFPYLQDKKLIDSFIIGYIDGDGYIRKRGSSMDFVILGNEDFLSVMVKRLEEICCQPIKVSLKHPTAKIYKITIHGERARKIFKHFYPIAKEVGALKRKWKEDFYEST